MIARLRQYRAVSLPALIYPALILIVNLFIVSREFRVDYSAYLESNEGNFIALARNIAAHPADMLWWPLWDVGVPYQNTYLPGLHIVVAAFSSLTGHSVALSYHQVCAAFFALGPVAVYFMAWTMTRMPGTSWLAALAYSIVSPTAWLMPRIGADMGSGWDLRRLQILAYYGEGPHTTCLFFVPLGVLFLYLALTRERTWMKIAAGLCLGLAVLMNAFAAVVLCIAALALIIAAPRNRMWRSALLVLMIGVLAYLWISPLVPPSVLADIRRNSRLENPFDGAAALGLCGIVLSSILLWLVTRTRVPAPLRIFFHFTLAVGSIILLSYYTNTNVVPYASRYGVTTDMGLCLSVVFGSAALFRKLSRLAQKAVFCILLVVAVVQVRHQVQYAHRLIQRIDMTTTTTYHLARWMNDHMQNQRVFVGGAHSFHFNAFTDTPQVHGGHDPMPPSSLATVSNYVISTGIGAGSKYLEICRVWLKAMGAHAFSVPGKLSDPYYRSFAHPEQFEGYFPVLWRESDTTIYRIPARSNSLAHVVPAASLVRHYPASGIDIDEMSRYVAALDDPALPEASFRWLNRHAAEIQAKVGRGQVISIQERYMPGWTAVVNGRPQEIQQDGLGFMVLKPDCDDCRITIAYDGGIQWRATCFASGLVTLLSLVLLGRGLLDLQPGGCL